MAVILRHFTKAVAFKANQAFIKRIECCLFVRDTNLAQMSPNDFSFDNMNHDRRRTLLCEFFPKTDPLVFSLLQRYAANSTIIS